MTFWSTKGVPEVSAWAKWDMEVKTLGERKNEALVAL